MSDATRMAAARLLTAAKEALAAQMIERSRTSVLLASAIAQYERSLELDEKMTLDQMRQAGLL